MPDQTDKFRFFPATFEGPATKGFAITSNESANLAFTTFLSRRFAIFADALLSCFLPFVFGKLFLR